MPHRIGQLLAQSIERAGQAVALINHPGDLLLWQSPAFAAMFETADVTDASASWSHSLAGYPELACIVSRSAGSALGSGTAYREPLDATVSRAAMTVVIEPLDSAHYACRLECPVTPVADLERFLHAQDGLFSISRSISVSEMATTLAHEINQPLGTIANALRGIDARLRRNPHADQTIHDALHSALEQATFSADVISRIRDFTHRRRPRQLELDCGEVLEQALALLHWMISAGHCRLELEKSTAELPVIGDATMLQQVIVNLVRNAVEAMRNTPLEERLLHIRLREESGQARLSIRDNGYGISGEQESLFVPFASSKPGGMGVGLNICRSFVELHQGKLWLVPGSNGGCRAELSLPLATRAFDA